jgi:hypothetical protein
MIYIYICIHKWWRIVQYVHPTAQLVDIESDPFNALYYSNVDSVLWVPKGLRHMSELEQYGQHQLGNPAEQDPVLVEWYMRSFAASHMQSSSIGPFIQMLSTGDDHSDTSHYVAFIKD